MDVKTIVPYSNPTNLTEQQQNNIIAAFNSHAYDMAAEYVWKKLSQTLGNISWNWGKSLLENSFSVQK